MDYRDFVWKDTGNKRIVAERGVLNINFWGANLIPNLLFYRELRQGAVKIISQGAFLSGK